MIVCSKTNGARHLKHAVAGIVVISLAVSLGACSELVGSDDVTRLDAGPALTATPTANDETLNAESQVIQGLLSRKSVLKSGGPYDLVVTSVLAANARAAEAELRAARLRAEAASKNWLPTIGPRVSLNTLGDVIAQIVVDQVIFDNGRKKGEREFAKADVEVAAVTLAEDTNDRAATALELYLAAAEARETRALHRATLTEMEHFEWIMQRRVEGGVSDSSDLLVLRQKLAEIRAAIRASDEAERTALAELNAMSVQRLDDVRGAGPLAVTVGASEHLGVTRARAEKERSVAAARIDRADQLPGASLTAALGDGSGVGADVSGQLGLGTNARLKSIEAAREAAARQVAEANEDANRELRKLESEISALNRQATEARALTEQARANLELFQRQYDAGQRQVMDVVGVYETFAARHESEARLKYSAIRKSVELARVQGALADGDKI